MPGVQGDLRVTARGHRLILARRFEPGRDRWSAGLDVESPRRQLSQCLPEPVPCDLERLGPYEFAVAYKLTQQRAMAEAVVLGAEADDFGDRRSRLIDAARRPLAAAHGRLAHRSLRHREQIHGRSVRPG